MCSLLLLQNHPDHVGQRQVCIDVRTVISGLSLPDVSLRGKARESRGSVFAVTLFSYSPKNE